MIRANTAENLRAGSKLPLAIHKIRPSSLSSLSINQGSKVQVTQNTELHQAVANRQFEAINNIVLLDPKIVTTKNNQGETAADWLQEYLNNIFLFEKYQELERLPKKIKEGDIEFVGDYLKKGVSSKLRFSDGNTLIHLAVQYNQPKIIELIRQTYSLEDFSILLNMENIHGYKPEDLANILKIRCPNVIKLLQPPTLSSNKLDIMNSSTDFLSCSIENKVFRTISKTLFCIKNENDFDKFIPLLPSLCKMSYLICNRSFEILKGDHNSFKKAEPLLNCLFKEKFILRNKFQFQKNLYEVSNYLRRLIQEDRINQEIKLSIEKPHPAWANKYLHTISINLLIPNTDIPTLIACIIHEYSHLINSSLDIKYYKKHAGNSWNINFNSLKLPWSNELFEGRTPCEWLDLLKIQQTLKGETDLPFKSWLAHHNADTFTLAVLGLAAFGWDCAEVEDSNLLIDGNRFLTALSDYSYQLQPTTEPRLPKPDNPKNHNLMKRILRKATRKPPSNPSTSSHASTAASSSPPGSPESDHNQKAAADSLMAGMVTMGIGENQLPGFSSTASTSAPSEILASSDSILRSVRSSLPWTP